MKSPLKWVGGKTWAIKIVENLYAPHRHKRFVDLTLGGGAVPLALQPDEVLANDINPDLINFWKWLASDSEWSFLEEVGNNSESYYDLRSKFNFYKNEPEYREYCAEAFWWLNRLCYNGLWRVNNTKGEFNVPFGKYKSITRLNVKPYKQVLKNWEFTVGSYDDICVNNFGDIPVNDESDFIYVDPPYWNTFKNYAQSGFTWANQVELADYLASFKVSPVVAFNSNCDEITQLYIQRGFNIQLIAGRKDSLASKVGSRKQKYELLITKNI